MYFKNFLLCVTAVLLAACGNSSATEDQVLDNLSASGENIENATGVSGGDTSSSVDSTDAKSLDDIESARENSDSWLKESEASIDEPADPESSIEEQNELPSNVSDVEDDPTTLDFVGDIVRNESGISELVKMNSIEEKIVSGPFEILVHDAKLVKLKTNSNSAIDFEFKEEVVLLTVDVEIVNTTSETMVLDTIGQLILDTGEIAYPQVSSSIAEKFNDFEGGSITEGRVVFMLESEPERIHSFEYVMNPPRDVYENVMGEPIKMAYDLD